MYDKAVSTLKEARTHFQLAQEKVRPFLFVKWVVRTQNSCRFVVLLSCLAGEDKVLQGEGPEHHCDGSRRGRRSNSREAGSTSECLLTSRTSVYERSCAFRIYLHLMFVMDRHDTSIGRAGWRHS